MDANECKVSVIIPVHNSEKTISYCLKKIIRLYNKKGVRRYYEVCSVDYGVDVCVCWSGVYYEEGIWLGRGMDFICYGEFWVNGGRQPVKLV